MPAGGNIADKTHVPSVWGAAAVCDNRLISRGPGVATGQWGAYGLYQVIAPDQLVWSSAVSRNDGSILALL